MKAILDVKGAHCGSCVYAIEHAGRKLAGVNEVRVHTAEKQIHVEYDGDSAVLTGLCDLVTRLGHSATIRSADADSPSPSA